MTPVYVNVNRGENIFFFEGNSRSYTDVGYDCTRDYGKKRCGDMKIRNGVLASLALLISISFPADADGAHRSGRSKARLTHIRMRVKTRARARRLPAPAAGIYVQTLAGET